MTIAAAETPESAQQRRKRELLLALLLLEDANDGVTQWDTYAPRPYRGLLLATPFDNVRDESGDLPPFCAQPSDAP